MRYGTKQTHPYISAHVFFILKFYQQLFHHLGFIRLRYDARNERFQLTTYSVVISRYVGAFFLPWALVMSYTLYEELTQFTTNVPLVLAIYVLILNQCLHLLRWQALVLRRAQLLNNFLTLIKQVHRVTGRPVKLSWFVSLQVAIKFATVGLFLIRNSLIFKFLNPKVEICVKILYAYYVLSLIFSMWCKDIPNHVFVIALKLLENSYALLNMELKVTDMTMQRAVCLHDVQGMRACNEKISQLRQLYAQLVRLSQQFTRHTQLHFLLTLLYDVFLLLAVVFDGKTDLFSKRLKQPLPWWQFGPTVLVCLNNLRFLCATFEEIAYQATNCDKEELREFLCTTEVGCGRALVLAQLTLWLNKTEMKQYEKVHKKQQDFFLTLLVRPHFTFFNMVQLDRRLCFKIIFGYCSFVYIYYMIAHIIGKQRGGK